MNTLGKPQQFDTKASMKPLLDCHDNVKENLYKYL